MAERVEGRDVTVEFDGKLCIHARMCVLGNPAVFVPNAPGQWIHPDAAPADAVMRIGFNCPSGAIKVTASDGATSEVAPAVNTARVRENGPVAIEAPLTLKGEPLGRVRAVLCRCGASKNKPFCDGSHTAAGFTASGEPATKESAALEARGGPVDLMPLKDGPLKVTGNLEIVSGTGRTVNRVGQAFLCRCGLSANKPHCDGSHKAAGFTAD
ncbi:MAG: CDGSH iron-sulfur domain-containing protein [Rhodobacteraceae bacterium]|jgi:CDGSH-type Zn-finger protein/uncharacterized Fe-S cluster protein YjdI|nr:CDGSH iron-sulfur domain-containing protein [Paracoccaceae bacterium]